MSWSQLEPKGKLGQSMALVNSLCSSTAFTTCPEHEPSHDIHDISYISSRRWRCVMLRYLWFTLLSRRCGGAALALVTQLLQRHDVDFANIVELPNWYKCLATVTDWSFPKSCRKAPPWLRRVGTCRLPSDHQTKASEGLGDELSRWGRWWDHLYLESMGPQDACHKSFSGLRPHWSRELLSLTKPQSNPIHLLQGTGDPFAPFFCVFFLGVLLWIQENPRSSEHNLFISWHVGHPNFIVKSVLSINQTINLSTHRILFVWLFFYLTISTYQPTYLSI